MAISTLTSLIEVRKKQKKSTYVAYVDFKCAYDGINRQKMWSKLHTIGIHGQFLQTLKSLYEGVKCAVKINGHMTEWLNVQTGLKQGCLLSTTLFNMYINDLSDTFKQTSAGISIEGNQISHLFYADDLVLIAETEEQLQILITAL